MSLQFIVGNSGNGKTQYLFNKITQEAKKNPRKNYLIIVPEQFTMQTQRQLVDLSENKAIMNIDVLSFKRLAYRVFDELGVTTLEVLEETGKNLVLRKLAQDKADKLSVLGPNISRIGYISEIKSLLSELVQYNIKPDDLSGYLNSSQLSDTLKNKLSDVLVMYREFEEFMKNGYITADEILNVLYDVSEKSQILSNAVIAFDEFTGFTPIQNKLINKLFKVASDILVTLTIDSSEDLYVSRGIHELFDMPKKTIKTLSEMAMRQNVTIDEPVVLKENYRLSDSEELLFMEKNLFRKNSSVYTQQVSAIQIDCLRDRQQELIYVARRINELVRKQKIRYREIAVVTGDVAIYDVYVKSVFDKYDIPYFIDTTKELLFHPFIEFIRSVPDIAIKGYSAEAVFRFLRCGFCDIAQADIDMLENYVLATGKRGKKAWDRRWHLSKKTKSEYDIEHLNEMREQVIKVTGPACDVFKDSNSTVNDYVLAIYKVITQLDIPQKLLQREKELLEEGMQTKSKEYGQIYKIVMQLFEKYATLLGSEIMKVEEFTQILDAGLDAADVAVIPPGYDCVTIGDIERTRLSDIKVMFFIGVNDGIVPRAATQGGIISQYERQTLKALDMELAPDEREQAFIQRYYLYMNMTKPKQKLYITYSRLDGEGKSAQPSYIVNTLKTMFTKLSVTDIDDIELIADISSREAAKDYLLCSEENELWYQIAAALSVDGEEIDISNDISKIIDARYECYAKDPISQAVAQAVYGRHITGGITRFEQFARCAYAHFLSYGLKLRERQLAEFSMLDMGNIYHDALYKYGKMLGDSEYDWFNVSDSVRTELSDLAINEVIEEYPVAEGETPAMNMHTLGQMKKVFRQTVWALTTQIRKGNYVPEGFEITFSQQLSLPEDVLVELTGRIDRTDVYRDDRKMYIKVLDYKSGKTSFDLVKLYYGTQLQLAVYMDAVMEERKKSQNSYEIEPGGMLYYHIDDPVIELKGDDAEMPSEEEINQMILQKLKPDGLINAEEQAYRGMDMDFETSSDVIPVKLKKDQTPDAFSKVISKEDFEVVLEYAKNKLSQIGMDIYDGCVDVKPIKAAKQDSCAYCSYQSVCRINSKLPGYGTRSMKNQKKDEIIEQMRMENLSGSKVDR